MDIKIAIIGLGYVGLPLAVEFGKKYKTIGFDINQNRINDLKKGHDYTNELETDFIFSANNLEFTSNIKDLRDSNFYIITVPTPIDENNKPDITALITASKSAGSLLKKGDI